MGRLEMPEIVARSSDRAVDLEALTYSSEMPLSLEEAFNKARRALSATKSFDEVKGIRDQAETLRAHAKRVKWSLDIQNQCAEIKLRAERKAGGILANMIKNTGQLLRGDMMSPRDKNATLAEMEISKKQSERWQRIYDIPEEAFENFLIQAIAGGIELSQAATLRLARDIKKQATPQDEDQIAQQRIEKIIRSLVALKRDLERTKAEQWSPSSREVVKNLLEDLLSSCK